MLAGVAAGAFVPLRVPLLLAALVLAAVLSVLAFLVRRVACFMGCVVAGFVLAGAVLAEIASTDALDPPLLRVAGPRLQNDPGASPATPSSPPRAVSGPMLVEGRLRQDAVPSAGGISLRLAVERVAVHGCWHEGAMGGAIVGVNGSLGREASDAWRAGRLVRLPATLHPPSVYRDPGVPDQAVSMARRGTALVGSVKSASLVEVSAKGGWASELAAEARYRARLAIARAVGRWSAQSSAVVTAILIGDRAGLDEEVERRLQEAGTYHVIAISGGNIAILAAVLLGTFRLAGIRGRGALLLAAAALVSYAAVVGGGSSVTRATLMAVVYLLSQVGDLRSPPLNAVAVSAALILPAAPLSIFDPGLALTFGATAGILIGAARLAPRLPRSWWARAPAGLLLASLCAEAALLPVSATAFSRITFAGLLLNFLAIPLMTMAQLGGMAVLLLSVVSTPLAACAGYLAHLGAAGLVESSSFVELVPWLVRRVPPPPALVAALYYAGWAGLIWGVSSLAATDGRRRSAEKLRILASAVVALSAAWILVSPLGRLRGDTPCGRLRVTLLDVGAGDAILVRFPDATRMLVDTGGMWTGSFDVGERLVGPALWALDIYHLDYLVITHPDPDHIGGAAAIVRDFKPGEIWEGIPVASSAQLTALREEASAARKAWRVVRAGDRLQIGPVRLSVLHPPPPDWERLKTRNDDSVVIDLRYGDVSVLLTGDIGRDVEGEVASRLDPAPVRVIKVPHHGSVSSSSRPFIAAARPELAVLSARPMASANPATLAGVLRRYQDAGCEVFRTDQDGAITIDTDGRTTTVGSMSGRTITVLASERVPRS